MRAAVPLVAAVEVGLYAWVVASAIGVAAVVASSATAYTALRFVGATVLIFLGIRAWAASRRIHENAPLDLEREAFGRWWRAWTTGALTQLSNPKVAVFMVAFYPQFVPAASNVLSNTLLLGLVQIVVDGGWYLLVAVFAGRAGALFARARVRRGLSRATGAVLIGLGVRMALSKL